MAAFFCHCSFDGASRSINARTGAIAPSLPDNVLVGGRPGAAAVQHVEDPTGGPMHVRGRWTANRHASRDERADASHASSISAPCFTDYAMPGAPSKLPRGVGRTVPLPVPVVVGCATLLARTWPTDSCVRRFPGVLPRANAQAHLGRGAIGHAGAAPFHPSGAVNAPHWSCSGAAAPRSRPVAAASFNRGEPSLHVPPCRHLLRGCASS